MLASIAVRVQRREEMKLFKSLAVALVLSFGFGARATANENQLTDDAILLFSGDETPMDQEEAAALSDTNDYDAAKIIKVYRTRVTCQSFFFFTTRCGVPGRILSVRLVNQFGFARCVPGRTFGATNRAVWVRGGCSGTFAVRYRR
jgi:hypothetical protein